MTQTNRRDSPAAADDDYRLSHMTRGDSYDGQLALAPFDAYMARLEARILRRTVAALFPSSRPRYLDFACGTGRVTETVAPLCSEAVGIDVSENMLRQARRKCPAVRFVQADLTRDDMDLGSFDLVTAFRFFGNAQHDLRRAVLRALHRALRPDGRLVLNSHRNPHALASLLGRATGAGISGMDLHFLKLRALLRETGFDLESVHPIGAWMYRSRLLGTAQDDGRAQRLERVFGAAVFAPIAPDVVIVARKVHEAPARVAR
jgi:SAM-dependent methyltransferase